MLAAGDAGAVSNRRDVRRRAEREDQCSRLTTAMLPEPVAAAVRRRSRNDADHLSNEIPSPVLRPTH